jgi:integrase
MNCAFAQDAWCAEIDECWEATSGLSVYVKRCTSRWSTAQETFGARWEERDLEAGKWTVPSERMKANKEYTWALSKAAVALLEKKQGEDEEFVVPGRRAGHPLSNMTMELVRRRMKRDDTTVHGFRSTFRDWVAERTNYPSEVAEMALAHAIPDKV